MSELGPFTQLHWAVGERILLLGAIRFDRLAFTVRDRFLTDGVDNSGERVMQNASGSLGASVRLGERLTLFTSAATSFESPTTTELVNQSNGTVGFTPNSGRSGAARRSSASGG